MKKIPTGIDNFRELIERDFYYVDKTDMITELLDSEKKTSLFVRPRRFGKSLNMSMLNEFFNIEKDSKNLFKDLNVSKSEYYKTEMNKYPIIYLNFKEVKYSTWKETYDKIRETLQYLYLEHKYVREVLDKEELVIFNNITNCKATDSNYTSALKKLTEYLYRYYNKQVIILIDEYDVPIQEGYIKGFYDKVIEYMRNFLSGGLKSNNYLRIGVLTGILRVSKESIFSGLNNFKVYGILSDNYNEYYGFSEEEVKTMLEYYGMKFTKEVKAWYDGYDYCRREVYNPWSVLNYIDEKKFKVYWVNSSGNELINKLITDNTKEMKLIFEKLILGEKFTIKYNENTTYTSLNDKNDSNTVLNFLLECGYLSPYYDKDTKDDFIKVNIPNKEVREYYINTIGMITRKLTGIDIDSLELLGKSILNDDKIKIVEILDKKMESLSYNDSSESFFHGYMLGIFAFFLENSYIVESNREAGNGRFDLMIRSLDNKVGIIIELKVANKNENPEKLAKVALKQIEDKEYYKELERLKVDKILKYAFIFKSKNIIVR